MCVCRERNKQAFVAALKMPTYSAFNQHDQRFGLLLAGKYINRLCILLTSAKSRLENHYWLISSQRWLLVLCMRTKHLCMRTRTFKFKLKMFICSSITIYLGLASSLHASFRETSRKYSPAQAKVSMVSLVQMSLLAHYKNSYTVKFSTLLNAFIVVKHCHSHISIFYLKLSKNIWQKLFVKFSLLDYKLLLSRTFLYYGRVKV